MTSLKSNDLWKLDFLEARFLNYTPRFPHTKKLLSARNNEKLLKRLPDSKEDAEVQIAALKSDYFNRKFYSAKKKLTKEVKKVSKNDMTKYQKKGEEDCIVHFLQNEDAIDSMIMAKLVKCICTAVGTGKNPNENVNFVGDDLINIIRDKTNPYNPSQFYKMWCQPEKKLNNYISNLWNLKSMKKILAESEWSFKIVRGNLTKKERDERKEFNKIHNKNTKDIDDGDQISDEESDSDTSDSDQERDTIKNRNKKSQPDSGDSSSDSEDVWVDAAEAFDKFAVYDHMVADPEVSDAEVFHPDPNIDYNQVTDEEESDDSEISIEESDFENSPHQQLKSKTSKKFELPDLAVGYYSGGSDDESDDPDDNDSVVKELSSQRKNRRGQRARQKIWAKKYGKEAKHIKTHHTQIQNEREQRKLEYEERCRRREAKGIKPQEHGTNANNTPLGTSRSSSSAISNTVNTEQKMHPSWEAKKLEEEKLKNIKFQGKKITFD